MEIRIKEFTKEGSFWPFVVACIMCTFGLGLSWSYRPQPKELGIAILILFPGISFIVGVVVGAWLDWRQWLRALVWGLSAGIGITLGLCLGASPAWLSLIILSCTLLGMIVGKCSQKNRLRYALAWGISSFGAILMAIFYYSVLWAA